MKKLISLLLVVVMVFSLCACSGSDSTTANADSKPADSATTTPTEPASSTPATNDDPNVLKAGFGRVDSAPETDLVHIAGGSAADDPATDGMLDTLAVTCIALQKNGETYLVYTCDIVDIVDFYKTVDNEVSAATGISKDHIILNATHTHSAPTMKPSDLNLPGAPEYNVLFNAACLEAAQNAIADLSPVGDLSYGSIMTENMVRVRHYLMKDGSTYGNGHGTSEGLSSGYKEHLYPSDEECQVILMTRPAEDKKDIVLFNLGAHATIVSGTNTSALSADFPFPARQYIEENGDYLAAYFIAAAGDQTPGSKIPGEIKHKNHFDYGAALGEYVLNCIENNMTVSEGTDISFYTEKYIAKRMKDGIEDTDRVSKAKEIMALRSQFGQNSSQVKEKLKEYGFTNYYEASGLSGRASAPETGFFPISTMLIGDVGMVFFAGEMFGSQGRQLKDNSPVFTFVITCSEDDQGYFPHALAKEESFYEYDQTKYAMGTGEAVAERYVETLTALMNGEEPAPLPPV